MGKLHETVHRTNCPVHGNLFPLEYCISPDITNRWVIHAKPFRPIGIISYSAISFPFPMALNQLTFHEVFSTLHPLFAAWLSHTSHWAWTHCIVSVSQLSRTYSLSQSPEWTWDITVSRWRFFVWCRSQLGLFYTHFNSLTHSSIVGEILNSLIRFVILQRDSGHRCVNLASYARHTNDCCNENHFNRVRHWSRENQKGAELSRILGLCTVSGQCSHGSMGIVQWISTDLSTSEMGKVYATYACLRTHELICPFPFFSFTDIAMDFPRIFQCITCHFLLISIQLSH